MSAIQKAETRRVSTKPKRTDQRKAHQLTFKEKEEIINWRDQDKLPNKFIRTKCQQQFNLIHAPSYYFIHNLSLDKIDRRRIPQLTNAALENKLLKWIKEMQKANIPIHDISIKNKAKLLQEQMKENDQSLTLILYCTFFSKKYFHLLFSFLCYLYHKIKIKNKT